VGRKISFYFQVRRDTEISQFSNGNSSTDIGNNTVDQAIREYILNSFTAVETVFQRYDVDITTVAGNNTVNQTILEFMNNSSVVVDNDTVTGVFLESHRPVSFEFIDSENYNNISTVPDPKNTVGNRETAKKFQFFLSGSQKWYR